MRTRGQPRHHGSLSAWHSRLPLMHVGWDRWMDGMDGWKDRRTDRPTDRCMCVSMDGWMDGQKEGSKEGLVFLLACLYQAISAHFLGREKAIQPLKKGPGPSLVAASVSCSAAWASGRGRRTHVLRPFLEPSPPAGPTRSNPTELSLACLLFAQATRGPGSHGSKMVGHWLVETPTTFLPMEPSCGSLRPTCPAPATTPALQPTQWGRRPDTSGLVSWVRAGLLGISRPH